VSRKIAIGEAPVLGVHPNGIHIGRCGNTLFHDKGRWHYGR
jgi:hypothetical protein